MLQELKSKIKNTQAHIGIMGQGYVGLPLAVEFGKAGFGVTGFDTDEKKVLSLNKGVSYILDVPSEDIKELVDAKRFKATSDMSLLKKMDVIIICVPTPLRKTKEPDISFIVSAAENIAKNIKGGQLIILESTTYPGTTEEVILPKLGGDGIKVGKDLFLAFSPERVDPGNLKYKTKDITKIVGGVTPACTELAKLLYSQIIPEVVAVSSTRSAEMVKLLENTFRSVNIGMVNELALMCNKMGLDVWEIIDAAKTKPFGFMPFYPGPGIGGHCLSEEERILVKYREQTRFIKIGELFHELKEIPEIKKMYYKNVLFLFPQEMFTLSFDANNKQLIFKNVKCLTEREYNGDSFEIKTEDDKSITITDRHPVFVQNGKLDIKFAKDLKVGERVPALKKFFDQENSHNFISEIDSILKNDIITSKVNSIRKVSLKKVYSLEVEDTNTFVSSYGIISHNCIPLDPLYLSWKARLHGFEARFIGLADEINSYMPHYVVERLTASLSERKKFLKGAKILIMGVTYKKDINDVREAPALEIISCLRARGAEVEYYDPFVAGLDIEGEKLNSVKLTKEKISSGDCVVIITNHSDIDYKLIVDNAKLVFDTRNALKGFKGSKNIVTL